MKISIRLKEFDGLNAERKHLVYIMLQPFKYGYSVLFANTFLRDKKIRTLCFLYQVSWLQISASIEQFC